MSLAKHGCYATTLKTNPLVADNKPLEESETYQVRVMITPLSSDDDLKDFLAFASDLSTQYKSSDLEFELGPNQPLDREMYGILRTSRCDKVTEIVDAFAQRSEVAWLEKFYPAHVHNRWSKGVCETANYVEAPMNQHNLTGIGHVVGIADTGIDMFNCYFYDADHSVTIQQTATAAGLVTNPEHRKILQYVNYAGNPGEDDEGHGTHTSGTVAGLAVDNYGDYKLYNGMAYDAKIAFFDMGTTTSTGATSLRTPSNIETDLLQTLYASGARVITNSWGTSSNAYDSLAKGVDQFMWDYPDAFVIFSAGNTGASGRNTVSSPSTNKNGASVGASLNDNQSWKAYSQGSSVSDEHDINALGYFSSRGPTFDSRLKPDYLAPGWYVTSALGTSTSTEPFCNVHGLLGTSMAAPTSAGHAVKVRQFYMDGYYPSGQRSSANGFTPSGALLKATLIHSSQAMDYIVNQDGTSSDITLYPSVDQGYGRIQMNKVLNFGTSSTTPISMFVIGDTDTSSSKYAEISASALSKTFTFTTNSATTQSAIRITMCYSDYPGNIQTGVVMVNTLKVKVVDSDGVTTNPYLKDSTVVSNTQVIDIPVVKASKTYTVTVSATTVTVSQPFALVVTGSISYLDYTAETTYTAPSHSNLYISDGARNYIIVLAIIVLILIVSVLHFKNITQKKKSLEIDPSKGAWTGEGQAGAMGMVLRMRQRAIEKTAAQQQQQQQQQA
eukprot:gene21533-27568_t